MIRQFGNTFVIDTLTTSYVFCIKKSGHPEHLYYGRKVTVESEADALSMLEKHQFVPGNSNIHSSENSNFSLEDTALEFSSLGKGDIREPFVSVTHSDGSSTSDFLFKSAEIGSGSPSFETLPCSHSSEGECDFLKTVYVDKEYNLTLEICYYAYSDTDVITRTSRFINTSDSGVRLNRLMSTQLDFPVSGYRFTTFNGSWAREMARNDTVITSGKFINSTVVGTSSSRANPFVMISDPCASENSGDVYGLNLVYSGNHAEIFEVSNYSSTRFVSGINPETFSYYIDAGEYFEAPEAVMTFSPSGFNGMSHNMHSFVRNHIVSGTWAHKSRPILLNSWEACYFDINEGKLLKLARLAKKAGCELFVMDDGWFGKRDNDTCSLGDWTVNTKKLPGGIKGICDKVNELGLDFGIWVEPEMVNVDSDLYRAHPDWAIEVPGHFHSEGRNQRILDLTRAEVREYIISAMTDVFSSANISYVKWDMNRTFTDMFSSSLPADRQGEVMHRYYLGFYECVRTLTSKFPKILFEGCAAGGNRFDLGMLCYFPQIWGSDNTDAICRTEIQNGYSYGYPLSCVSSHVSGVPNHQTLRRTPLETRFSVASFGVLGYEINLADCKDEELENIASQIELYKKWREVFFFGDFYRGRLFSDESSSSALSVRPGNINEWTVVSPDGKKAVGNVVQKLALPNTQFGFYRPSGLKPDVKYHFTSIELKHSIKDFGDLINTTTPIHIKQDSLVHNVAAHFVKMNSEKEDYCAFGDTLMYCGVKLAPAFGGTGYNDDVRLFLDFASRLYFMEECEG